MVTAESLPTFVEPLSEEINCLVMGNAMLHQPNGHLPRKCCPFAWYRTIFEKTYESNCFPGNVVFILGFNTLNMDCVYVVQKV